MTKQDEMTDQEKSVKLAKLMGWKYKHDGITGDWYEPLGIEPLYEEWQCYRRKANHKYVVAISLNLYSPANMALAWRVLNWAYNQLTGKNNIRNRLFDYLVLSNKAIYGLPSADAQRLWLDKILELATRGGDDMNEQYTEAEIQQAETGLNAAIKYINDAGYTYWVDAILSMKQEIEALRVVASIAAEFRASLRTSQIHRQFQIAARLDKALQHAREIGAIKDGE
jgi:hypothetical protein